MSGFYAFISVAGLVIGVFMIYIGFISGLKWKMMGEGLLFIAPSFFVALGTPPIGLCCFVAAIILAYSEIVKRKKVQKENAVKKSEGIGATALDRFFVECVLAETDDFTLTKNIKRAELLADKYKLKYPNGIEALYQQGLEEHKKVSQRFVLNHLEDKRAEERKQFDELNKYADLIGKEKRIAMLTDIAKELRKKAKDQKMYADMLIRSGQQKERDWATWGGVANGIAGVGAGVSTAVELQMQNLKIREENEQRRRAALPAYMFMSDSASGNANNADAVMKEIEDFKLKLISDDSKESLMERIKFTNTDVLVSETGAAMVCTNASLDSNFVILGDVKAVVDGTIIAKIYDGDVLCGTAQMVLPIYGLGQNIPLNGICIDCCKQGVEYKVKFVAKNLWAVEK